MNSLARTARYMRSSPMLTLGLVLILFALVVALLGPLLVGSPDETERLLSLTSPDSDHWFGTDQLGRDVLARVVHGMRLSLLVGLSASFLQAIIGVVVGVAAGWFGKYIDAIAMRFIDVILAIPYLLLAIAIIAFTGQGVAAVVVTLAVTSWLTTARLVRNGVFGAKQLAYVQAARASGVPPLRIIWRHILPNIAGPILVLSALSVGGSIVAESSLSYLGLGIQEPLPSLGLMIARSRSLFGIAPGLLLFPSAAIVVVVVGFLFVADGLSSKRDSSETVGDPS